MLCLYYPMLHGPKLVLQALVWEARTLELTGFEKECAAFIGKHVKAVAAEDSSDGLQVVLSEVTRGAHKLTSAQLDTEFQELYSCMSLYGRGSGEARVDAVKNRLKALLCGQMS